MPKVLKKHIEKNTINPFFSFTILEKYDTIVIEEK